MPFLTRLANGEIAMTETSKPIFRTPEDVAPELGMTPTELRRYCRQTGFHTRLSKRRVMLDDENIRDIIAWVKAESQKPVYLPDGTIDPFA